MKYFFKALTLTAAIALCGAKAQAITVFGKQVVFKGDVKEWSEPIVDSMFTDEMQQEGKPGIPIKVRVRVVRKIFRGCRYEVEVTNLDASRRLSYEMYGEGVKLKKHKLKPGETDTYGTDTFLDKNCPDVDGCANGTCEYAVRFFDVNVKD
jgi:hypothetical protein